MSLHLVPSSEPWLTYQELAERMGCSVKTLERMKDEDGLPYVVWGRRLIRFHESEVMRWAERRRHGDAA